MPHDDACGGEGAAVLRHGDLGGGEWRAECVRAADDAVRSAGEGGAAWGARSLESERRRCGRGSVTEGSRRATKGA